MAEEGFERRIPFGSWDDLAVARERLLTEGWELVPYDQVEEAVRGFSAVRAGEPRTLLYWEVYGRPLSPTVTVCSSWEEFVREMTFRVAEDMEKSDALAEGLVGFVSYGRASSARSEVFRIPVSMLVEGGEPARASLMAVLQRSRMPSAGSAGSLKREG
jgi:hypothetical protein